MPDSIAVIGGGPAGACMAVLLAKRGLSVDVYEKRADPRVDHAAAQTSVDATIVAGPASGSARRSLSTYAAAAGP